MSIDPYIVIGSAVVGFLVGMTGAGGGALMTPMLILFFNVKPSTAISSDLVAAVLMRPVGAVVHMTKKTVNYGLVGYMVLGSVPAALLVIVPIGAIIGCEIYNYLLWVARDIRIKPQGARDLPIKCFSIPSDSAASSCWGEPCPYCWQFGG